MHVCTQYVQWLEINPVTLHTCGNWDRHALDLDLWLRLLQKPLCFAKQSRQQTTNANIQTIIFLILSFLISLFRFTSIFWYLLRRLPVICIEKHAKTMLRKRIITLRGACPKERHFARSTPRCEHSRILNIISLQCN